MEKFEKKGLKIDKERVLTYSHLSCPFECSYCFVEGMTSNQQKNITYLNQEQIELLKNLPEQVKLIMLGCDTEFFQNKDEAIQILNKLSGLGKDISVITKFNLSKNYIDKIKEVDNKLQKTGNFLTFSVSIPSINNYKKWEPRVPSPEKRIVTLIEANKSKLKTLVAIRPLLPSVTEAELEKIVQLTKDYSLGYYAGPLYLKTLDLIKEYDQKDLIIEKEIQPHWMLQGNIFYKIEKNGQFESLKKILEKYNKPFFEGAAEAIEYLKKQDEKH